MNLNIIKKKQKTNEETGAFRKPWIMKQGGNILETPLCPWRVTASSWKKHTLTQDIEIKFKDDLFLK